MGKGQINNPKIIGGFLIVVGLYSVATGNSSGWILVGFGGLLFLTR